MWGLAVDWCIHATGACSMAMASAMGVARTCGQKVDEARATLEGQRDEEQQRSCEERNPPGEQHGRGEVRLVATHDDGGGHEDGNVAEQRKDRHCQATRRVRSVPHERGPRRGVRVRARADAGARARARGGTSRGAQGH